MKTVGMILCGGFGKRLRPITETVPKPLVEVKENYTILDKQLFDFKNANIDQIYLLTGFLSEKYRNVMGKNIKELKLNIFKKINL